MHFSLSGQRRKVFPARLLSEINYREKEAFLTDSNFGGLVAPAFNCWSKCAIDANKTQRNPENQTDHFLLLECF
jgi:hypothetical protein